MKLRNEWFSSYEQDQWMEYIHDKTIELCNNISLEENNYVYYIEGEIDEVA